jgi:polysaccharide biosynthesis/export protein
LLQKKLDTRGQVFLTWVIRNKTFSGAVQVALEGATMLKCLRQKINRASLALGLLTAWAVLSGCESHEVTFHPPPVAGYDTGGAATDPAHATTPAAATLPAQDNSASMPLREGDTVKISFPGAPSLDTVQTIRLDGKITLSMVGEIKAAGLTPKDLEAQLLKVYDTQLVVKEVSVIVQTSVFTVYVTGAVLRPGKISSDRVETPLEAIVEAGIDHTKANLKKVTVIRDNENGTREQFKLNLDDVLKGKPGKPFTLKPMDMIYVPEKFMWY